MARFGLDGRRLLVSKAGGAYPSIKAASETSEFDATQALPDCQAETNRTAIALRHDRSIMLRDLLFAQPVR